MKTQLEQIKAHLESGKSITQLEALYLCGCFRLSSIIHRLRNDHKMNIKTSTPPGEKYAVYSLEQELTQQPTSISI